MGVLLTATQASLEYPTKRIFDCVSLGVNEGDRIGIVGNNGDGKSSLLKMLCGTLEPDSGQVLRANSPTVGLLGQRDSFAESDTCESVLEAALPRWQADRAAREVATALVGDIDLTRTMGSLSGGQRRRCDLARVLIGSWDVLALDEPTNHLDLGTINWLAQHLKTRWKSGSGALMVVTHDRWFLDEVCTSMWEVNEGRVIPFEGGFSAYVLQRVERQRLEELAKRKRENQLRKELAWLSRGAQARRSKPKFHLEAAAALIADVPPLRNEIELKKLAMARLGKQVYELSDVCLDRGGARVVSDLTWTIGPGDRIGILGANGAGKSSLLGLLSGSLRPTRGHIKTGLTVKCAHLSQNLDELAPIENDMVRVACGRYKTYYRVDGRNLSATALLERVGFSREELNTRVCELSGGQRRRLQLLFTLFEEPNVLLLDEPGNDLDTDMLAATEDLLDSWAGTLIVVSHDRYLLERVCDQLYAIVDGTLRHLPRGVDEYLELVAASQGGAARKQPAEAPANQEAKPGGSLGNAERHKLRKQLAALERKMHTATDKLGQAKAELDACDPYDYVALGEAQARVSERSAALAELENLWLELSESLEADGNALE